jgi:hypothetical protein
LLRFSIYGFLALLILAPIAYGVWFWVAKSARDAAIAEIVARGEPVWFADLEPPPLPPEQDGTADFLAALENVSPLSYAAKSVLDPDLDPETGYRIPKPIDDVDDPYGEPRPPEPTPDDRHPALRRVLPADVTVLREAVAEDADSLRRLRSALAKGRARLPIDYADLLPVFRENPESQSFFDLNRLLRAEAMVSLKDGDVDASLAAVMDMLRLGDLIDDTPGAFWNAYR